MTRRAFGTDRLMTDEGGTAYLVCGRPKEGWVARRKAELVRKEFPGTCVRWDEDLYEVVSIDELQTGVRYSLQPWDDSHTIRAILDYDESTESRRRNEHLAEQARRRKAAGFTLFSVVTGLLPAETQLEMERELGVSAWIASLVSVGILMMAGGACLIFFLASVMGGNPLGLPLWVYLIGIYFWIESMIRLGVVLGQSKPIGSFPVVLGFEIVASIRGRGRRHAPAPKLTWTLDEATIERDAFVQREPFLALLSPAEQRLLSDRYGFDWSARGEASAWVLLVFATFVAAFAMTDLARGRAGAGDLITVVIMGYLIIEQINRLRCLRAGSPAGSVLGALVRPMARKLMR